MLHTLLLLVGCRSFYQNDFIATEYAGQIGDEKFIYLVYQTGDENYRTEFKSVFKQQITALFERANSHTVYSKQTSVNIRTSRDTLIVSMPFKTGKTYYQSPKGALIELTANPEITSCEENGDFLRRDTCNSQNRNIRFII